MTDNDEKMTSAKILGAYLRDLEAEGINPDLIYELVLDAGKVLAREYGIAVSTELHEPEEARR